MAFLGITALFKTLFSGSLALITQRWQRKIDPSLLLSSVPLKSHFVYWQDKGALSPQKLSIEDFERISGMVYLPSTQCLNAAVKRLVQRRCSALFNQRQIAQKNLWEAALWKKELDSCHVADLFIGWVSQEVGWGLFARSRLLSGSFIAEYSGLLKPIGFFFCNINPYCFHYPLPLSDLLYYTIDAQIAGKETSFINHSKQPNCEAVVLFHRGFFRVVIIALQAIEQGEELTYDYGPTLWGGQRRFSLC